jgi:hypothetical protein
VTPLPTFSQSSATVNPYGYPACVQSGAPSHPAHGPGLMRGMLTPPRCSKSRLHRQRIRAKFSLSLYRPLPDRGRTGRCEVSRGNHRLPSCSPTPIITCRAARLTCYVLTATLREAPRYPRDEEGCALLPRHHAEPKELLSTDHFDATPPVVGMTLVTPRPSRVSARGASPHRCAFHLLRRNRRNLELLFPSLSNRDFTARSPRRHGGHGDFTEASGFSVHLRVLRVSVVNKVLEFLFSLASHNASARVLDLSEA